MKKLSIFILLISIFALTGCGKTVSTDGMEIEKRSFDKITDVKVKESSSSSVVCSMTQEDTTVTMDQTITLNFKSNTLKSANITINAVLDSSLLDYIDTFVDQLESQFEDFEYGENIVVKKTSKGAKVTYTMDEDDFEDQYGSASTKSAIISEMEASGYTCD